jgi:hypothetical protein
MQELEACKAAGLEAKWVSEGRHGGAMMKACQAGLLPECVECSLSDFAGSWQTVTADMCSKHCRVLSGRHTTCSRLVWGQQVQNGFVNVCCYDPILPAAYHSGSGAWAYPVQADVGTAGAGGGRAIELPQAATLHPLQYIKGMAKAITGEHLLTQTLIMIIYACNASEACD